MSMDSAHSKPASASRAGLLTWAYLAFHARRCIDREEASWQYLLEWASRGGKTAEVPESFGAKP